MDKSDFKQFLDNEAELSGSDASPDEAEDDIDELEEDEEEQDLPDEDQQRNDNRLLNMRQDLDDDLMNCNQLKRKIFGDRFPGEGEDVEDGEGEEEHDAKESGRQFLDQEAELSGSDASSDEEEEEGDDVIEEDVIDPDLPDEEEQRNEILKVKMRQDLDDDLINFRQIKERIFAEHREGPVRRKNLTLKWMDDDDQDHDNTIKFDSDDDESSEDDGIMPPVKINYRPIRAGEQAVEPDCDDDEDVEEDEFKAMEATQFQGAFGGPAGSILSYVIRDKVTHEKMADQKDKFSGRLRFMKLKGKRFTRKGPVVKTVSEFEKRKWFSKL